MTKREVNPILKELREIRERMFEEAGGSLETLVKQLQEWQKETIENRNATLKAEPAPGLPGKRKAGTGVRKSKTSK